MALDYTATKALHHSLTPFSPYISVGLLPYLAFLLLTATFALGFYFTTLPKSTVPVHELTIAAIASILGGFGVVALFCSAGVYV